MLAFVASFLLFMKAQPPAATIAQNCSMFFKDQAPAPFVVCHMAPKAKGTKRKGASDGGAPAKVPKPVVEMPFIPKLTHWFLETNLTDLFTFMCTYGWKIVCLLFNSIFPQGSLSALECGILRFRETVLSSPGPSEYLTLRYKTEDRQLFKLSGPIGHVMSCRT